MPKPHAVSKSKARKPYEKPTFQKWVGDEAKAELQKHVENGDQGAKDLLQLLSSESAKVHEK